MKNIAVIFGGESVEHDVSVITGVLTLNSLDKEKYNVIPVYIDRNGVWYTGKLNDLDEYKNLNTKKLYRIVFAVGENNFYILKGKKLTKPLPIAAVINCLHGERGEDGSLAGVLQLCKIPIASSKITSAAISMDKIITKIVMKGLKVPTVPFFTLNDIKDLNDISLPFDYPVIVKPDCGGSSIGIKKASDLNQLGVAVKNAFRYGNKVIIEPMLSDFIEINCAAYRNEDGNIIVSECEKPIGREEVLTFSDKYESGSREFPAKIEQKISDKIKNITKKVYGELDFSGVIRIDFFVMKNKVYLNEINSVPGSMAYYLFCNTFKEYSKILDEIINFAIKEFNRSNAVIKDFRSEILSACGGKGAKKVVKNK